MGEEEFFGDEDFGDKVCRGAFPIYKKIMIVIAKHIEEERDRAGGQTPRSVFVSMMLASAVSSKIIARWLAEEDGMPEEISEAVFSLGDDMAEKIMTTFWDSGSGTMKEDAFGGEDFSSLFTTKDHGKA